MSAGHVMFARVMPALRRVATLVPIAEGVRAARRKGGHDSSFETGQGVAPRRDGDEARGLELGRLIGAGEFSPDVGRNRLLRRSTVERKRMTGRVVSSGRGTLRCKQDRGLCSRYRMTENKPWPTAYAGTNVAVS